MVWHIKRIDTAQPAGLLPECDEGYQPATVTVYNDANNLEAQVVVCLPLNPANACVMLDLLTANYTPNDWNSYCHPG